MEVSELTLFLFIIFPNYFRPSVQQIESFSILLIWISFKFGMHFPVLGLTMVIDDILSSSKSANQIRTGIVTRGKFLNLFSYGFFKGSEAKLYMIMH